MKCPEWWCNNGIANQGTGGLNNVDCPTCEGTGEIEDLICPNCSGSGEGMHDGTKCSLCKGSGVYNGC